MTMAPSKRHTQHKHHADNNVRRQLFRSPNALPTLSSACCRGPSSPALLTSFSSRYTVTVITILAMSSVSFGIIAGSSATLTPPDDATQSVVIKKAEYMNSLEDRGAKQSLAIGKYPNPFKDPSSDITVHQIYEPSMLEAYVIENGRTNERLGYDREMKLLRDEGNKQILLAYMEEMPSGCELWTDPTVSVAANGAWGAKDNLIYQGLQVYRAELEEYDRLLANWKWNYQIGDDNVDGTKHDLRNYLPASSGNNEDDETHNRAVCDSLEVHPDGLRGVFKSEASLSKLPWTSRNNGANESVHKQHGGFIEPFLPPLRHPEFCFGPSTSNMFGINTSELLSLGYLIHDFATLCKNHISKYSRTVFVDFGAALDFHNTEDENPTPSIELLELYQRFGIVFDHIFAYELEPKDPALVYEAIPDNFKAAYHWYNVGVESDWKSYRNPLRMIADTFGPEDFIVVKLDIDTSSIEIPLAKQLLEDPDLAGLVDVLYFEHHVTMKELAPFWKYTMMGSMQDSLEFFTSLREHGIAAHYWV